MIPESLIMRLATTPAAFAALDDEDCQEGYWDGRDDAPTPGPNRSDSYVQGWFAGMRDGHHRDYYPTEVDIIKAWRNYLS